MNRYRQPWSRVRLPGHHVRLQVLDPSTAFELEPQLVDILGDALALVVAAPDDIVAAVGRHAASGGGRKSIQELATDPFFGPEMAADSIRSLGLVLANSIAALPADYRRVSRLFKEMVLGRIRVTDTVVEDAIDWDSVGFSAIDKWMLFGAQLRQTFGPLWTRSPYTVRGKEEKGSGIPEPKSVPMAVRWADNLARLGSASSSREILEEWTPVQMIEIVESAAYTAMVEQRALDGGS